MIVGTVSIAWYRSGVMCWFTGHLITEPDRHRMDTMCNAVKASPERIPDHPSATDSCG